MSEPAVDDVVDPLYGPEGELLVAAPDPDAEPPETIDGPEDAPGEPTAPTEDDEPADGDEPPADEPVADTQPDPLGITPEALDEMMTKLANSAKTWRKRVAELLGANFDALVPCELCEADIPGFHWPAELVQPENELHERLLYVLQTEGGPSFLPAPHVHECETCGGLGKVKTGSNVAGKTTVTCPTCLGAGYFPPPQRLDRAAVAGGDGGQSEQAGAVVELAPGDPIEPPAGPGGEPVPQWEDRSKPDPWGSPGYLEDGQENPNWGRFPQYKDPSLA